MQGTRLIRQSIGLLLAAGLLLCTAGCGLLKNPPKQKNARLSIVATVFPQYDFARQIAGDRADVVMLLRPGMEAHSYEPSPKDIIRIARCDVFLHVGGESERWLDGVLASADNPDMAVVSAMACVEPLEEETADGMQSPHGHDHSQEEAHEDDEDHENHEDHEKHEDHEEEYDEHVWTSPMNAIAIVNEISRVLCERDPANADYYCANTERYVAELLALDNSFREIAEGSKRRLLVFGDRFPLLYFVREYGLEYRAAFPGCAAETEPNAATVAYLIDTVRAEKIPVIFYIELSNHKVADAIAEATGTRTRLFHTCHNISAAEFAAGATYVSLMRADAEMLKEALN